MQKSLMRVEPGSLDHIPKQSHPMNLNPGRHIISQKRKVFLLDHCFIKPYYYKKLLGIDTNPNDDYDDYDPYSRH